MTFIKFHFKKIWALLRSISISNKLIFTALIPYYLFTIAGTILQSIGMVLIVNMFTGKAIISEDHGLMDYLGRFIHWMGSDTKVPEVIPFLIGIFSLSLIIRFGLLVFDGYMSGILRQKLQETVFKHFLYGDWAHMRNFRVGNAVGTNTQESLTVSKYLTSGISVIYYLLSAGATLGIALFASFKITVVLGIIGLPLMWGMKKMLSKLASFSKQIAVLRNKFSADITDRLNGLLQVHVDNNYQFHLAEGLRTQPELTRLDILSGVCSALTSSFNLLMPLTALIGFFIWIKIFGSNDLPNFSLIASVGILGLKVASQVNGAVAAIGNLSRLSGSLYPVIEALELPLVPERKKIETSVASVVLKNVSYDYGGENVISGVTFEAKKGLPLILNGRSGKGKTTIANLISGLYFPKNGEIKYVDQMGIGFDSRSYSARIGFVPQDIYLFRGSLRTNLVSGRERSEKQIWDVLEQVDAAEFVRSMGGLDTESAEAGRSLSGGQRRRLGIAKVLLSDSEILIFDEVTAGLDQTNKKAVLNVIDKLSQNYIVVVISHEDLALDGQVSYFV